MPEVLGVWKFLAVVFCPDFSREFLGIVVAYLTPSSYD